MNKIAVNAVVDNAAELTIISYETFRKLKIKGSGERVRLQAAGEHQTLEARIVGPLNIRIGNSLFVREVLVAAIKDPLLLGMDLLWEMDAKIHIREKTLICNKQKIPLWQEGGNGPREIREPYAAIIKKQIRVKPESELVVHTPFLGRRWAGTRYLEPQQNLSVLVARVVHKDAMSPLISYTNTTKKTVILERGTRIGTWHPIDDGDIQRPEDRRVRTVRSESDGAAELPEKLRLLYEEAGGGKLTSEQKAKLKETLVEFQDVFAEDEDDLGSFTALSHEIDTGNAEPVKLPLRRTPYHFVEEEEKVLKKMLDAKIIQPSNSSWAAAPVLVKKKDGQYRYCLDYRALNKITKKDVYPIPLMTECLDALEGSSFFSSLDANQAYYQIPMHPDSKERTAFCTKHGLFEFNRLPFGLANAPSTYSRAMALVLKGLSWDRVLAFLDDICVLGSSFEIHLENLRQVLTRFRHYGLKLKPSKCHLFQEEIELLGRKVGQNGITLADHSKETIQSWRRPGTIRELQQFLGFANFHRGFIPGFAHTSEPLYQILKKKRFEWNEDREEAFEALKEKLMSPAVLKIPTREGTFRLDTDASNHAIGAELMQEQEGVMVPIAYASFALNRAERRYCTTKRELLAVVRFCNHFRHYLLGREFKIRTDHHSLIWLTNFKNLSGQLARWTEEISRFSMEIEYRSGFKHVNADALSRPGDLQDLPCKGCKTCQNVQRKWGSFEDVDNVTELATAQPGIRRVSKAGHIILEIDMMENPLPNVRVVERLPNTLRENQERIRLAQGEDRDLSFLHAWLSNGEEPDPGNLALAGKHAKYYWSNKEVFYMEEGIIYKKDEEEDQVVIPREIREEIISLNHDLPTAGHQGVDRTRERIQKFYFWHHMSKHIKTFIRQCRECNRNKGGQRKNRFPRVINHAGIPMEKVHIDFLGPLPTTKRGNQYILVISDNFTKWLELIPLPNQTAEVTAAAVVDQFCTRFGFPHQILTDQGRNFEATLFKEVCNLLRIEKKRTTAYRPSANGQAERQNRTLMAAVRCAIQDKEDTWDEYLPQIAMALRSAVNKTTGQTPNKMMLGRHLNTPATLMVPRHQSDPMPPDDYCARLEQSMQEMHESVRDTLKTELKREKREHDVMAYVQDFKAGDVVYLVDKARLNKLKPIFEGPAIITEILSPCTMRVLVKNRPPGKVMNHDLLKLCWDKKVPRWIERQREATLTGSERLYCICNGPDDYTRMVQCNWCDEWYHVRCVNQTATSARRVPRYLCPLCKH